MPSLGQIGVSVQKLYAYVRACIHTYTHTYACVPTHTHTHTHMHNFNFIYKIKAAVAVLAEPATVCLLTRKGFAN
jgi:cytochrome c oxidase assembly factor CtaG